MGLKRPSRRRIVANLYAEESYRAEALGCDARRLSPAVREALTVAGSLLRIFAENDGDELWTVGAIESDRLPAVGGVPHVTLRTGDRRCDAAFWMRPPTGVSPRWVSKTFAHEYNEANGSLLSGARLVHSWREFDDARQPFEATRAGDLPRWVCKSLYSAAGRDRVWEPRTKPNERRRELQTRIGSWLAVERCLLIEPWVPRVADFGACGRIGRSDQDAQLESVHELLNDSRGRFRAVRLPTRGNRIASLCETEHHTLVDTFRRVGRSLAEAGYEGPFGIDAFRYVDGDGVCTFHPLSEINPRWSMGAIARRWVDRLRDAGELADRDEVELRLSRADQLPEGAIVLVRERDPRHPAAWLV